MFVTVYSLGVAAVALMIAYREWKEANSWRDTAAKQQDAAAKARMDAEEAKIWLADEKDRRKALENRLELAKTSERDAIRRENAAKYAMKAEQDKSEELRRMLTETREDLDSEREAFEQLREENRALKQAADEVAAERRKLEEEKGMLIELANFMNYRGNENGQIEIPQRD